MQSKASCRATVSWCVPRQDPRVAQAVEEHAQWDCAGVRAVWKSKEKDSSPRTFLTKLCEYYSHAGQVFAAALAENESSFAK